MPEGEELNSSPQGTSTLQGITARDFKEWDCPICDFKLLHSLTYNQPLYQTLKITEDLICDVIWEMEDAGDPEQRWRVRRKLEIPQSEIIRRILGDTGMWGQEFKQFKKI